MLSGLGSPFENPKRLGGLEFRHNCLTGLYVCVCVSLGGRAELRWSCIAAPDQQRGPKLRLPSPRS